jgi:glycerol-3-phosphate dehydrogenase (NAD(P)+)
MERKIAVLGAGSWGTALARLLARKGEHVTLWGRDRDLLEKIRDRHTNAAYLPDVTLPETIFPTDSMDAVASAELVLIVTPSQAVREVATELSSISFQTQPIFVSCSKGIEQGSGLRMTQILQEFLPRNAVAALSGPSHAEEVGREMPTAVVIGSSDIAVAEKLQDVFAGTFFRVYTSTDVAGIELGGALKNIFAIAAGVSDGLGFGDNTKAALVTRSLAELIRLGTALGGRQETFQGLSGIGDLIVTCFSRHSRNRAVGERLGRGEKLAGISKTMTMVAEGVPTALSAMQCAERLGIDAPILEQVHAILYQQRFPQEAMLELLNREQRAEAD